MKSLCFIIDTLGRGGAERVMSNLANGFAEFSDEYVIYFVCNRHVDKEYKLSSKINLIFVCDELGLSRYNPIAKVQQSYFLKKFFRKKNIDVGIAFMGGNNFALLVASLFNNNKSIISVRNYPEHEYPSVLHKILYTILFPKADKIVFQTKEEQQYFSRKIRERSVIIANPVSDRFYHCKSVRKSRRIVTVGRLTEQKNHKMLIEAFEHLSRKYNDISLHIYGEGDLRCELEECIEKKRLKERVFLHGVVENIEKYICDAVMFVMTSRNEGMQNALMEAMALGLPVISTDCAGGGPRELISSSHNGLLVNDKYELINAMQMLLDDDEYRKSIAEKARASAQMFHENKVFATWKKIVDEI